MTNKQVHRRDPESAEQRKPLYISVRFLCVLCASAVSLFAAGPDWPQIEKEAVANLQAYVRIPSVNPPADTHATAELLRSILARHGLTAKLYPSGPDGKTNLIVRLPGSDRTKKPVLLLNHMDVVPVDRKSWSVDPFAAQIRDGVIWGRGTMDMKGLGMMHLMAIAALHDAGVVPPRDIVMLSSADEELNGTYGVRWMIEHHFDEIDAAYVFDEGGFGSREVFSSNKLVFGISVGEKQPAWMRLRARGTAGHGSQPIPDNANLLLIRALEKAMLVPPAKPNPVVQEMMRNIGTLAKNKFTSGIHGNTATLTSLSSGVGNPVKVNVIPSIAEATLDCRLLPGVNAQEFLSEMRARINDPNVTVELISHPEDPGSSNSRTPLFSALEKVLRKYEPDAVVTPILVPYSTDSAKLRKKGLTCYGFAPMVLDADTVASMHGDREHLPISEFLRGIHIFFDVLRSDF
jgi:acetylornithine deacetylase/succinyl-diaminopimelate desuccinylase-like protein